MIYPDLISQSKNMKESNSIGIGIVPLSIPIIAGPGTIGTIIYFLSKNSDIESYLIFSGLSLLLSITVGSIFYFSRFIKKIIGDSTLTIIERIMGLILSSMGVQITINGIVHILEGL